MPRPACLRRSCRTVPGTGACHAWAPAARGPAGRGIFDESRRNKTSARVLIRRRVHASARAMDSYSSASLLTGREIRRHRARGLARSVEHQTALDRNRADLDRLFGAAADSDGRVSKAEVARDDFRRDGHATAVLRSYMRAHASRSSSLLYDAPTCSCRLSTSRHSLRRSMRMARAACRTQACAAGGSAARVGPPSFRQVTAHPGGN